MLVTIGQHQTVDRRHLAGKTAEISRKFKNKTTHSFKGIALEKLFLA